VKRPRRSRSSRCPTCGAFPTSLGQTATLTVSDENAGEAVAIALFEPRHAGLHIGYRSRVSSSAQQERGRYRPSSRAASRPGASGRPSVRAP